jgi:alanyl-tRNA synthetase
MSGQMKSKTKRLYFKNPYQIEFESAVKRIIQRDGKYLVVLEESCFYPESGGQPADRGEINGIEVLDVFEENGEVFHVLSKEISGKKARGKIDWKRRFDHMQQHAGQHILSQCFHRLMKGKTVSFHLGESVSTVDIEIEEISDRKLLRVEEMANQIVFEDREIKTYFVSEDKIPSVPLRKPPKKSGLIRIVEVKDFEHSACGGTHPRHTGEIGMIKIIGQERIRQNLRFSFVCGQRAFHDYSRKHRILMDTAVRLSSHEEDIPNAVDKLVSDLKDQKKKSRKVSRKLYQFEAEKLIQGAEGPVIRDVFREESKDQVRYLALNIIEKPGFYVLFGLTEGNLCHIILARSEDIDFDMRKLISDISSVMMVKGGGRPSLVELVGEEKGKLESALDKASASLPVR